jgi:hypothetical protein
MWVFGLQHDFTHSQKSIADKNSPPKDTFSSEVLV